MEEQKENLVDGVLKRTKQLKETDHSSNYDPSLLDLSKLDGIYISSDGYIKCKCPVGHPIYKTKYVYIHRLIVEKNIGRLLTPQEEIHHKDKNKLNNFIENLELCANHKEHSLKHPRERQKKYNQLNNYEWLKREYDSGKTLADIAMMVGCRVNSVSYAFIRLKILKRKYTVTDRVMAHVRIAALKAGRKAYIEYNCDPEWIKVEYSEKKRSFRDIGLELGWHKNKVKKYLESLKVILRNHHEQAGIWMKNFNKLKS